MMFSNEFRCFVAKVLVDFMKAEYNQSAGSLFAEAYDSNIVFGIGSSMNFREQGCDSVSDEPVVRFSDPDASAELDDASLGSDKSILEKAFKQHKIKPFKQISGIKPFKQITGIKPSKQITGKPVKQRMIPIIRCNKLFTKTANPNYQDRSLAHRYLSEHEYMMGVYNYVMTYVPEFQMNEQGTFTKTSGSRIGSKQDATIHREDSDSEDRDWMKEIYINLKQYVQVNEQGSFTKSKADYTYDNFSSLPCSKFEHQNFDEMLAKMDIPVNKIVPGAASWKEVFLYHLKDVGRKYL